MAKNKQIVLFFSIFPTTRFSGNNKIYFSCKYIYYRCRIYIGFSF